MHWKGKYLCRLNLAMDSGSIWILLIVENWKHCSKIIFKYVNSIVGPNFKEKFAEICTCWSCEQCMRPTQKNADAHVCYFQCNPNIHSMILSHTKSNTWRIYCQKKSLCHQGVTTNNHERNWYIVVFQYTISFLDLTYWQLKFWWENISLAFDFGPCLVWVEDFFCHVGHFEFLNSY